ncbi:MAG: hypothetical protein JWQ48_1699 [Conexibacter sp.]|nr:hypothetical protein [Conexibacter sp.]
MRVLFATVGLILVVHGVMLIGDLRGAARWWLRYSERQRELFGRFVGPRYDREGTRWLGAMEVTLGVLFLGVGILGG